PARRGAVRVREDAHLRQPPGVVRGGDRPGGSPARQLPAGVHPPGPHPRGDQPRQRAHVTLRHDQEGPSMIPLTIGTTVDAPERPAVIDGSRFNRHTFWCGQSGSGKTYALGVVLEQLLLQTELPIAVLDPNADFVRVSRTRDDVTPEERERFADFDIRVFHSSTHEEPQLHARYVDLSVRSQAAVGRLDPIADEEEYNALLHLDKSPGRHFDKQVFLESLASSDDPARRRLGMRIDNLEILDWPLWSFGGSSAVDTIDERPRV